MADAAAAPWSMTLTAVCAELASGRLSAVELAGSVLDRIEETEPRVHAYECVMGESLLAEAERADAELAESGPRGPLHGVPIAIKDVFDVAGVPTTCSSPSRRDLVATEDAEVVKRLRAAGALVCGKTVTHEFAFGVESPPTRSPWNLGCIPGGSSGGSGAAVAVGSCIAAIGTDTGCSIRLPSAICGIAGLKPTYGRVSNRGMVPLSWSCDHVGPMGKTVEDCATILQHTAGPDPADPSSVMREVPDFLAALDRDAAGLRIGVPRNGFFQPGDEEVERLVREAIATLEAQGAEVLEVDVPHIDLGLPVAFVIALAEAASYHRPWLAERGGAYGAQVRTLLEAGSLALGANYVDAQRVRALIKRSVQRTFEDNRLDLLATPTAAAIAPPAGQPVIELGDAPPQPVMLALARNLAPFDLTGQPAMSVPCGFSHGQPVGLQLVGRPFDEATVLRAAHAYEAVTPWHREQPQLAAPGASAAA
ncbi:MAG: Asp-tRNA(Asn)/Glu-tRNA(Gln) amidotransferase GatCAB subunit A [Actinobacteria bacterium]|nr:Asp-tRNA(Asn)/Glu-tRNA(Gln) amidotransferase GatCAB subunit A [Actinomycetota bacterium]